MDSNELLILSFAGILIGIFQCDALRNIGLLLSSKPSDQETISTMTINRINSGQMFPKFPDNYSFVYATNVNSSLIQQTLMLYERPVIADVMDESVESTSQVLHLALLQVCEQSPIPLWGLLDLTDSPDSSLELGEALGIPTVSRAWMRTGISVTPRSEDILKTVVELLRRDNITRSGIAIITSQISDVPIWIDFGNVTVLVFLIPLISDSSKISDMLSFARAAGVLDWIVMAESRQINDILLSKASSLSLTNASNRWFFVFQSPMNPSELCPSACGLSAALILHPSFNTTAVEQLAESVNMTMERSIPKHLLKLIYSQVAVETMTYLLNSSAISTTTEASSTSGLPCNYTMNGTPSEAMSMKTASLNLNFSSIVGDVTFTNATFSLDTIVDIMSINLLAHTLTMIGKWSMQQGLSLVGSSDFLYPSKKHYTILVIQEPPFVIREANGSYVGYSIDVLLQLAEKLNFDFSIVEQEDGIYGTRSPNGSWSGAMAKLYSGKVDILLGAILITSAREEDVDFTIPYADFAGLQLMGRKQIKVSTRGNLAFFIHAFDWTLWLAFFGVILFTGLFIFIIDRYSPYSYINRFRNNTLDDGEMEGKIFSVKESYWFVLGAVTQAGETFDPRSISCRILVIGFWFFAYLIMALYTANLAAQLTADKLVASRPTTLDDFSKQTTFKYSVVKETAAYEYLVHLVAAEKELYQFWRQRSVKSDVYGWSQVGLSTVAPAATWRYPVQERATQIMNQMLQWTLPNTTAQALHRIKNDDWTILMDSPLIKYYTANDCQVEAVGEPFAFRPYGIAVRKNSAIRKSLDLVIGNLQRDRIMEKFRTKWWSSATSCGLSSTSSNEGLGMDTLGGAFIFLGSGLVFSLIIFVIEIVIAKGWGTEWAKKMLSEDPTVLHNAVTVHSSMNLRSMQFRNSLTPDGSAYKFSHRLSLSMNRRHSDLKPPVEILPNTIQDVTSEKL